MNPNICIFHLCTTSFSNGIVSFFLRLMHQGFIQFVVDDIIHDIMTWR
jgi:hypothetical protein